jgi:hypothetical protein
VLAMLDRNEQQLRQQFSGGIGPIFVGGGEMIEIRR